MSLRQPTVTDLPLTIYSDSTLLVLHVAMCIISNYANVMCNMQGNLTSLVDTVITPNGM